MAEIKNILVLGGVSKASDTPKGPGVWITIELTSGETLSRVYKPDDARELARNIETAANIADSEAVG